VRHIRHNNRSVGKELGRFHIGALAVLLQPIHQEAEMAVASVSKITAASPTSFDAAVQEGLARASKTLRGTRQSYRH
jgi:hypothetical protein